MGNDPQDRMGNDPQDRMGNDPQDRMGNVPKTGMGKIGHGMPIGYTPYFDMCKDQWEAERKAGLAALKKKGLPVKLKPPFDDSFFDTEEFKSWEREAVEKRAREKQRFDEWQRQFALDDPDGFKTYTETQERASKYEEGVRKQNTRHMESLIAIEKREKTAAQMRLDLQLYERETKKMCHAFEMGRRREDALENQRYQYNVKQLVAAERKRLEHDDFVLHARRTFLTTEMKRTNKRRTAPMEGPAEDTEAAFYMNKVMTSQISKKAYFNYIRTTANERNKRGDTGAYDGAKMPEMALFLKDRTSRQQEKRVKFVRDTNMGTFLHGKGPFLFPQGGLLNGKDQAYMVDTFEKMMNTVIRVSTDDVIAFVKWIQTKGIEPQRDPTMQFPTLEYVVDAPVPLKEICYLIRLLLLDDNVSSGINTCLYIQKFADYIEAMLEHADFNTIMGEPQDDPWSNHAYRIDHDSTDEGGGANASATSGPKKTPSVPSVAEHEASAASKKMEKEKKDGTRTKQVTRRKSLLSNSARKQIMEIDSDEDDNIGQERVPPSISSPSGVVPAAPPNNPAPMARTGGGAPQEETSNSFCWLCEYQGNRTTNEVVRFIMDSIPHMAIDSLVTQSKFLLDHVEVGSATTTAGIRRHITEHMLHPRVKLALQLQEMSKMQKEVTKCCVVSDVETGERTVNPQAMRVYLTLCSQVSALYKVGEDKLIFNNTSIDK
ncbi:hypothetical protein T484DRAFT_1757289 [Baffinella frigidus]|nr:hypothetical protein T484DRAFT_1757289 [Cryptophyta sp. CCMP2293]